MPRGARLDTPGTLHHIIVRGIERRKIVDNDLDRENFIILLGQVANETDTAVYAWALMSNHFYSSAAALVALPLSCAGYSPATPFPITVAIVIYSRTAINP